MTSNVDNRPGQGAGGPPARSLYWSVVHHVAATFIAAAQTTPYSPTPYTGTLNATVNFPQPNLNIVPNAAGTYNFNIGAMPYGARVLRASQITAIAFAGATITIALGNASGGAQFVAAVAFGGALGFAALTVVAANVAAYVEAVDQTPVWASIVVSAGTLTAGQADVALEYIVTRGPQGQF